MKSSEWSMLQGLFQGNIPGGNPGETEFGVIIITVVTD